MTTLPRQMKIVMLVPLTWTALLSIEKFPQGLEGMRAGDLHEKGIDSDEAFYDDTRILSGRFSDGVQVDVQLSSGQSNYWIETNFYYSDGSLLEEGEADTALASGEQLETETGHVVELRLASQGPYGQENATL